MINWPNKQECNLHKDAQHGNELCTICLAAEIANKTIDACIAAYEASGGRNKLNDYDKFAELYSVRYGTHPYDPEVERAFQFFHAHFNRQETP